MPGVRSIAAARAAVLSGVNRSVVVSTDGQPISETNRLIARVNVVSDGYFETLGISRLRGRGFAAVDTPTAPRVAVVTRALADRLWPQADPIGRTLMTGTGPLEVVGVVADNVYVSVTEADPPPFFYLPVVTELRSAVHAARSNIRRRRHAGAGRDPRRRSATSTLASS